MSRKISKRKKVSAGNVLSEDIESEQCGMRFTKKERAKLQDMADKFNTSSGMNLSWSEFARTLIRTSMDKVNRKPRKKHMPALPKLTDIEQQGDKQEIGK